MTLTPVEADTVAAFTLYGTSRFRCCGSALRGASFRPGAVFGPRPRQPCFGLCVNPNHFFRSPSDETAVAAVAHVESELDGAVEIAKKHISVRTHLFCNFFGIDQSAEAAAQALNETWCREINRAQPLRDARLGVRAASESEGGKWGYTSSGSFHVTRVHLVIRVTNRNWISSD